MSGIAEIRPSPIAGTWYSGDPARLRQQVDEYLSSARLPAIPGHVTAIIAPHAGHRYSGRTAGHAFATVLGQERELVAVVSPMHAGYPANLLTSGHQAYGTPLGPVRIDRDALAWLDEILTRDGMPLTPVVNDKEHSLEIELPFLQRALRSDFKLLPVMVRSQSPLVARRLGHALAQVMQGRNGLMVASTDLSHFYPEDLAQKLDEEMLRRIHSFSPDDLFNAERSGKGFACGVASVAAVLWAARELGGSVVEILHHSTSGEETGDYSSVVGYGAAVVVKHTENP
ncbi:MAG: AmmeMemoRadiSam system protein B [Chloroflexi bacterium]|nr:MAG: AmmeMemoRadiSam system protein B [Chloroflexota bacterium]